MALPLINLSLIPVFPANVVGDGPVTVQKDGLTYILGWDVSRFAVNAVPNGMSYVLSYDPAGQTTELIPVGRVAADWSSIAH